MNDALKFEHLPGIASFVQTMFPGGSPEPKRYTVLGYTLIHAPLTLEKDQQLLALIERAGGRSWDSFLSATLKDVIETLFKEGFVHDALQIVLEFEDASWWAQFKRTWWMRLAGKSKRDLVGLLNNQQLGEIIADFFPMNVSLTQKSSGTSSRTTSSLKSPANAAASSPIGT